MASTETAICNLSLMRMGQELIGDIDGTTVLEQKCALVFDQKRDELLTEGPELGWKFARKTKHDVPRNKYTITGFASASSTTTTVTATHAFIAGDMVEISGTTNYDGQYTIVSVSTTVSFVITKVYVANDATGTAYWTSNDYAYRYAIPTSKRVVSVKSYGQELSDWVKEGAFVLTNEELEYVDITYVQAITDVTLFPDHFVSVLVFDIAIELTYNINQDLKAIQLLQFNRSDAMAKAIAMDERNKYVKETNPSWVNAGNTAEVI